MHSFNDLLEIVESDIKSVKLPEEPSRLYKPITYALSAGGKRVRPIALLMACNIFSDDIAGARKPALAVEIFHNFTLLHDDIMDNAFTRRGQATVNKKWDANVALLSGDVMLIYAYKILSETCSPWTVDMIRLFNQIAVRVCEGQQQDMDLCSRSGVAVTDYLDMIEGKTAALLAGALKMGAICGGASPQEADTIYSIGLDAGLAFQLQDDLLDTYGDPGQFGKSIGGDIIEGKNTFLLTTAFSRASEEDRKCLTEAISGKNIPAQDKIAQVKNIYDKLGVEEITKLAMNRYYDKSIAALDGLCAEPGRTAHLRELILSMKNRIK